MTHIRESAARQPMASVTCARIGRKTNCPVATLADKMPTTRPRRATNQRAADGRAKDHRCHARAKSDDESPQRDQVPGLRHGEGGEKASSNDRQRRDDDLRNPKRSISAAANGAIRPNSKRRIDSADEIWVVDQPNSFSSGRMKTPGAPTEAELISDVKNVTATMTQP